MSARSHAPGRRAVSAAGTSAASLAALAVLALAGGPLGGGPLGGGVAHADDGRRPEVVVPPGTSWYPRQETLLTASDSGYLSLTTSNKASWTGADGTASPVSAAAQYNGSLWARHTQISPVKVQIGDYATGGTISTLTVPDGQQYTNAFTGGAILTTDTSGTGLHIVRDAGDGQVTDQAVTGVPANAALHQVGEVNGDLASLAMLIDGQTHWYVVDFATASAREPFAGIPGLYGIGIGGTWLVADATGATAVYSVRREDPAGTVVRTPYPASVPAPTQGLRATPDGDRVLLYDAVSTDLQSVGGALWSVPEGGGDARLVLAHAENTRTVASDGSVLVIGGSGIADWAVRRVSTDGSVTALTALAPLHAAVYGLAYSAGRLVYSTDTTSFHPLLYRDATAGAVPAVTEPSTLWPFGPAQETHLQGLGNGTVAFLAGRRRIVSPVPGQPNGSYDVTIPTQNAVNVLDGDGDDVIADTSGSDTTTFGSLHNTYDTFNRPVAASAVWNHVLWSAGTTRGSLRPYNLRTLAYGATVQTDAPCTKYTELQADGRWLYWSCGTTAGVFDRATGRTVAVPVGEALLGDGFVVRRAGGQLVMTDVHTDVAVTTDVAALPQNGLPDERGVTWTVDKYAGGLAYIDAADSIHVIPSLGVPRSAMDPAPRDYDGDGVGDLLGLTTVGTLDIRPGNGSGGVGPSRWDVGSWPVNWTYVAIGDLNGDGCNDLLTRNPTGSGTLVRHLGGCDGPPNGTAYTIGAGWNIYNSLLSPGDLNGDGRPDLLARTPSGDLYFYAGNAAGVFAPRVKIGFGYGIYSLMTGVQDLNADGAGDVLARDASGVLWRYDGDGKGGLKARVRIGAGWNAYNAIVGVGALSADGRNDLIARDGNGDLWRYDGLGTGLFAPRVKIGWAWQAYKSLL